MGNSQQTRDSFLGQTSLLKALYSQRAALKYNINKYRIKQNYIMIGPDLKHEQARIKFSRFSARKLKEIRQILNTLQKPSKSLTNKSKFISKLEEVAKKNYLKFVEFQCPEQITLDESEKIKKIREHLKFLEGIRDEKRGVLNQNCEKLSEITKKGTEIAKKRSQLADLSHYYNFLKTSIQFLEHKTYLQVKKQALSISLEVPLLSHSIFVLKTSRDLVEKFKKRVNFLHSKLEKKSIVNESVINTMRYSADFFETEKKLDKTLETLKLKENTIEHKINNLRFQSIDCEENLSKDENFSSIKIEDFSDLPKNGRKHIHLSELPEDI